MGTGSFFPTTRQPKSWKMCFYCQHKHCFNATYKMVEWSEVVRSWIFRTSTRSLVQFSCWLLVPVTSAKAQAYYSGFTGGVIPSEAAISASSKSKCPRQHRKLVWPSELARWRRDRYWNRSKKLSKNQKQKKLNSFWIHFWDTILI